MNLDKALDELLRLVAEAARRSGAPWPLVDAANLRSAPRRGVYFFLDPAEESRPGHARIVRVGTHGLKRGSSSTLRQRLSQHRGTVSSRQGNHRGSIFRLLVGQALTAAGEAAGCASWGIGSTRSAAARILGIAEGEIAEAEAPVECAVTEYLSRLLVVCVAVEDEAGPDSLRGTIERGAIASLAQASREGLIAAGPTWLGRWSNRSGVRHSALWNQNHVDGHWSPAFLLLLRQQLQG